MDDSVKLIIAYSLLYIINEMFRINIDLENRRRLSRLNLCSNSNSSASANLRKRYPEPMPKGVDL